MVIHTQEVRVAPRVNIYLPTDLAEEVRAADLNVSQIAQEALRAELDRRELTAGADVVVARLRGTLGEEERRQREQFYEWGKEWAQTRATVAELEAFETLTGMAWDSWIIPPGHSLKPFMADLAGWGRVSRVQRGPAFEALIEGALTVWGQLREDVYSEGR